MRIYIGRRTLHWIQVGVGRTHCVQLSSLLYCILYNTSLRFKIGLRAIQLENQSIFVDNISSYLSTWTGPEDVEIGIYSCQVLRTVHIPGHVYVYSIKLVLCIDLADLIYLLTLEQDAFTRSLIIHPFRLR